MLPWLINKRALPLIGWANQVNRISRRDAKHAKKTPVFVVAQGITRQTSLSLGVLGVLARAILFFEYRLHPLDMVKNQ